MRASIKYILFIIVAFATLSCDALTTDILPDSNEEIEIPEYGFIYFNGQTTKGKLYEPDPEDDRLKANFGVIGYTYNYDNWVSAEPQARPNVFDSHPEQVTWLREDEIHSYTEQKAWLGNQLYSFFAFYPETLTTSAGTYEGNPYIDFTFSRNILASQVDVMTAHVIDVDYRTRSVSFEMKHRLTAIDVVGNNLYGDSPNDEDEEPDVDEIEITSMSITFDNLLYDKVKIPLNMRDEQELDYYEGIATDDEGNEATGASYTFIPPVIKNTTNTPLTTSKDKSTIIIIPQKQYIDTNGDNIEEDKTLNGIVKLSYKCKKNNETIDTVAENDYEFSINRDLIAGHRYYIQLNFAAGDVTIAILESDMWDDYNINYSFE